jgi:hypothetical protein
MTTVNPAQDPSRKTLAVGGAALGNARAVARTAA